MSRKGMTRLEAVQMWVNGFNAVPTQMIAKLMQFDPDDWQEISSVSTALDMIFMKRTGYLSMKHAAQQRMILKPTARRHCDEAKE